MGRAFTRCAAGDDRVLFEHQAQGGMANGELRISSEHFRQSGAPENGIAGAIWECEAAGALAVKEKRQEKADVPSNVIHMPR